MGTHYQGSEEDQNTLNAYIKLMRASDSITARLNKHLSEHDLTLSQFGVMEALHHLGPLNQRSLGEKLLKSGGNITMVIDNLEKGGWVTRKRNPDDRRSVLIHLTEEGKEFIESFFPKHLNKIKEEFAPLSDEEKQTLGTLCKKIGKKPEDAD
jgi:MarR family 2-MHQ and catechol resistance regulon transcriptional repressor